MSQEPLDVNKLQLKILETMITNSEKNGFESASNHCLVMLERRFRNLLDELTKEREARWEYEKGMADTQLQLSEALRALKWYATDINWIQGRHKDGIFYSVAVDDKGKLAQSAISSIEGGKDNQ